MPVQQLDRIEAYLDKLNRRKIQQNFDRVHLVIADEGNGKSTLMLQMIALYLKIRGEDATPENILNSVVWGGREEFKQKLLDSDQGQMIAVQDAAHTLHKKDAMDPEQKDLEKSLLDIRIENYPILLGYQDWGDVADILQRRRAEVAFVIPRRGIVRGYNRSSMDERYDGDGWPDPDFKDRFPSLEGTTLWERFEEVDAKKKRNRLKSDEEVDDKKEPQDVVEEIKGAGVSEYVEENEFNGQQYISKPLIKYDYPELSEQEAEQVQHALRRETDAVQHEDTESESETTEEGGTPHV